MGETGKGCTAEKIVSKLREAQVELASGLSIVAVAPPAREDRPWLPVSLEAAIRVR